MGDELLQQALAHAVRVAGMFVESVEWDVRHGWEGPDAVALQDRSGWAPVTDSFSCLRIVVVV